MIARLQGKLLEKNPPQIIVDCQGVGYEVDVPMSTFYNLPEVGSEVVLHIQHIVREDAQLLYGFLTKNEKALFCQVLKVSGIGPRTALSMLSSMSPGELSSVISNEKIDLLTKVPGIGKKTAERIVLELKDKVVPMGATETISRNKAEIIEALEALGFSTREAGLAMKEFDEDIDVQEGLRAALKKLYKKG